MYSKVEMAIFLKYTETYAGLVFSKYQFICSVNNNVYIDVIVIILYVLVPSCEIYILSS
jgi:hypothetical protein